MSVESATKRIEDEYESKTNDKNEWNIESLQELWREAKRMQAGFYRYPGNSTACCTKKLRQCALRITVASTSQVERILRSPKLAVV